MNPFHAWEALWAPWHVAIVGAALVVVAGLVNRFAPSRRPSLRRGLMLFLLYALATALDVSFGDSGFMARVHELLEGVTVVHLGAILIFDVVLPRIGFDLPALTVDLILGAAYALTVFGVLAAAGVDFTSVMAASTVMAAVLTISLQSTLGNVVGGVAVQLDGSIHAGEWLRLESGKEGRVREIRWRHTVLETRDGDSLVVPNASLLGSTFLILGKRDGRAHPHRMWVKFQVDFRYPPAEVCSVVVDALRATPIPNVAATPPPDAICLDLAARESYGLFAVRYWIVDVERDDPTSSVVRARIHAALRRAGIPLARPSATFFAVSADEENDAARIERRRRRAVRTLRDLELFRALTDGEVEQLAGSVLFAPFAAGETITRQGAVARFLYILQKGQVEVRLTVEGEEKLVTTLDAPGFFGEMGLMTGEPRQASVVALTDVVCHRLEKASFDRVIRARPEIAAGVSAVLAERRVQLESVREGLDLLARQQREATERERILHSIRNFFGLDG